MSFENRLNEAKDLVRYHSVKKYVINGKTERWVVVGNKRDYLVTIDPYWCRCYDFQHNLINNSYSQCKHILAVQIAIRDKIYDIIEIEKEEYDLVRQDFLFN